MSLERAHRREQSCVLTWGGQGSLLLLMWRKLGVILARWTIKQAEVNLLQLTRNIIKNLFINSLQVSEQANYQMLALDESQTHRCEAELQMPIICLIAFPKTDQYESSGFTFHCFQIEESLFYRSSYC